MLSESTNPRTENLMDNLERSQFIARIAGRISSDPAYTLVEARRDFRRLPINDTTPADLKEFELQFEIIESYLAQPDNYVAINLDRSLEDLIDELNIINNYIGLRALDGTGTPSASPDFAPLRQYYRKLLKPLLNSPDQQIKKIAAQIVAEVGQIIKLNLPSGKTVEISASDEILELAKSLLEGRED